MSPTFTDHIANAELVRVLRDAGFGAVVDQLTDPDNFTKNGRLNKSALARTLGIPSGHVDHLLAKMRAAVEGV